MGVGVRVGVGAGSGAGADVFVIAGVGVGVGAAAGCGVGDGVVVGVVGVGVGWAEASAGWGVGCVFGVMIGLDVDAAVADEGAAAFLGGALGEGFGAGGFWAAVVACFRGFEAREVAGAVTGVGVALMTVGTCANCVMEQQVATCNTHISQRFLSHGRKNRLTIWRPQIA